MVSGADPVVVFAMECIVNAAENEWPVDKMTAEALANEILDYTDTEYSFDELVGAITHIHGALS